MQSILIILPIHTVIKTLYISRRRSAVELRNISGSSIGYDRSNGSLIDELNNFNPSTSSTSAKNLLAYRPNYNDSQANGLAVIFVNIEGVFPCVAGTPEYYPVCKIFTYDEDGLRNGRAIVDAADCGNNIKIFGNNLAIFAFAIAGCSTMDTECFPIYTDYSIVCLLPRSECDG